MLQQCAALKTRKQFRN